MDLENNRLKNSDMELIRDLLGICGIDAVAEWRSEIQDPVELKRFDMSVRRYYKINYCSLRIYSVVV